MSSDSHRRPDMPTYFMGIAMAVRARADCSGNRVGALLVVDRRIVSTGYNGTPENMPNCSEGGCFRCEQRDRFPSGTGYDLCICVHAEQNALLAAARFGISVAGAALYSTMRPCFGCTKELLQAKVAKVYYLHDWTHPNAEHQAEYERLQSRFPGGIRRIDLPDPDAGWAITTRRGTNDVTDESGHHET